MSILVAGRITGLVFLAIIVILAILILQWAKRGKVIKVREIAAMAGTREAVARCAETGRPCLFTTGHGGGGLYTDKGPGHMAGVAILGFVSRQCAKLGARVIALSPFPEMIPLLEDTIRQAYLMEGKPEEVTPDMVRFLSSQALAYKLAYIGEVTRENAGAAVICGYVWASDALHMAEPGVMIGAIQIGGAPEISSLSMLGLICDYTFMGEELYAGAAVASEDPVQLGVLFTQDIVKIGLILMILAGFLLTIAKVDISQIFSL